MKRSSLRVYVRRLLGRRGVFMLRNAISSLSFYLGVYDDPGKRPLGISAMVVVYNEEDWVEPSLLSIKDLVDEYVVLDSSTDNTPKIIHSIREGYGLNMKYMWVPQGDIAEIRNRALRASSYRWILVWDGDFVLHEDSVGLLRGLVEGLDPRRHYLIYWPWLLLCGDLEHVCGENPYHVEHWLYTYSGRLRYQNILLEGNKKDTLVAPLHLYRAIYIDRVLGVHLAMVKKPYRVAISSLWHRYRREFQEASRKGIPFEEFARAKAKELYGTDDLDEVGRRLIGEVISRSPRHDAKRHGELPSILRKYIK